MIDWQPIVNRLRSSRGSLEIVSREIGSCPVHLRRLARGEIKDTKFRIGVMLLDLHSDDFPEHHKGLNL